VRLLRSLDRGVLESLGSAMRVIVDYVEHWVFLVVVVERMTRSDS